MQRGIVHLNEILHGPVPKSSEEDRSLAPSGSLSLQGKDFVDELRSPVCKNLGLFPLGMLRENGLQFFNNFFGCKDWITKSGANFPPMRTRE